MDLVSAGHGSLDVEQIWCGWVPPPWRRGRGGAGHHPSLQYAWKSQNSEAHFHNRGIENTMTVVF